VANVLTHIFLPLLVVYVLYPERFQSPLYLMLGGLGIFPDFDKFLGFPGLLHSLLTILPICIGIVLAEYLFRRRVSLSPFMAVFIGSHLVLDFISGGLVPILFPFIETGFGLQYPARIAFGDGFIGIVLRGSLIELRTTAPQAGFNTYGFIDGSGVAVAVAFLIVYLRLGFDK